MSIEIANESGVEVDSDAIQSVARHALDEMGVNPLAELSILLVEAEYMAELNHRWMDGDGPTDVLAFPMDESSVDHGPGEPNGGEPALLGDIVLCPAVTERQAREHGRSGTAEAEYLLVHGLLHLLGYDHAEPDEKAEMFGLNDKIIAAWAERRSATARRA